MARRPTTLEAAVDDMALAARRANVRDDRFELGSRGRAAVGADVELRQLAVEQARDMAADRMGVVEHDPDARRLQTVELGRQSVVIGAGIEGAPLGDRRIGGAAKSIELSSERRGGTIGGRTGGSREMAAYEMRISDWRSDVCSSDLSSSGAAVAPPLVPMLNCGSSPSNRRGTWLRIECAS